MKIDSRAKFKAEYVKRAERCARTGMTDAQIGAAFDVSETTINNWKLKYPEFKAALDAGKVEPDNQVERSLFERANGYSHPAKKIFCQNGQVTEVDYIEHYPPDVAACIFWLKNRRPDDWRDRVEHTGKDGAALAFTGLQIIAPKS